MRLIDADGSNRGVLTTEDAMQIAREAGMDLVEVAPNAEPPVARVMDYGKFIYEKTRRDREARKHQKQVEVKTIKLSPKIANFHRSLNVKRAREWLEEGKKVKVVVRFRGGEITYPEIGRELMDEVAKDLHDVSAIEQQPNMEGWSMTMLLTPSSHSGARPAVKE
ncbi:MAG: translation initiation factor IF-3 [Candidatus Promineifilaceae bacterium]